MFSKGFCILLCANVLAATGCKKSLPEDTPSIVAQATQWKQSLGKMSAFPDASSGLPACGGAKAPRVVGFRAVRSLSGDPSTKPHDKVEPDYPNRGPYLPDLAKSIDSFLELAGSQKLDDFWVSTMRRKLTDWAGAELMVLKVIRTEKRPELAEWAPGSAVATLARFDPTKGVYVCMSTVRANNSDRIRTFAQAGLEDSANDDLARQLEDAALTAAKAPQK